MRHDYEVVIAIVGVGLSEVTELTPDYSAVEIKLINGESNDCLLVLQYYVSELFCFLTDPMLTSARLYSTLMQSEYERCYSNKGSGSVSSAPSTPIVSSPTLSTLKRDAGMCDDGCCDGVCYALYDSIHGYAVCRQLVEAEAV